MGGFYYDLQNKNEITSVSLHANKKPKYDYKKNIVEWVSWDNKNVIPPIVGAKEWNYEDNNYKYRTEENKKYYEVEDENLTIKSYGKEGENGPDLCVSYGKVPLITSIIKDNFTVGVANNWSESSFESTLSDMFNGLKSLSPYAKFASQALNKMQKDQQEYADSKSGLLGTFEGMLMNAIDIIKPYVDEGTDYLNRALVTQTSRFSNYTGTGISIGGLDMKFTLFPDWDSDGNIVGIYDKLNLLYPYILGSYIPPEKSFAELESSSSIGVKEVFDSVVGWQLPPGGYRADIKNLDTIHEGTLKLKFGTFYSIENLVVKDFQMTFSKQMVKMPKRAGNSIINTVSPLYCEIQISFYPSCKYSNKSLEKFTEGNREGLFDLESKLDNYIKNIKTSKGDYLKNLLKIKSNV